MRYGCVVQVAAVAAMLLGSAADIARADEGRAIGALQSAYQREANAVRQYATFASRAHAEGCAQPAVLFEALADAERIHAAHFAIALEQLGCTPVEAPESFLVGTTAENLRTALDGEVRERHAVYPLFMQYAREECCYDALAAFRWARDAELTHANRLAVALAQLEWSAPTAAVASFRADARPACTMAYLLCTGCGRLYAESAPHHCTCGTSAARYARYEAPLPTVMPEVLSAR